MTLSSQCSTSSGLTFLDAAGVHAIVAARTHVRRAGRRLLLLRAPASVRWMFTLTGTSDDVDVFDLDPGESPVQALLQLARRSVAS